MKTALITGISGQDGSYLAKLLLTKGYDVIGTVRSYRNNTCYQNFEYLEMADKIILEEIDLFDFSNIMYLFNKYHFDEVYHLAAQSSVGLSFSQPIGTISFNAMSVGNLLEAIRLLSLKTRFYHASSSEMFGQVGSLPINLNTPMKPISPYAVSKVAAHYITTMYRDSYGVFASNGVLFNHESYLRSNNFFIKKLIDSAVAIKIGELKEIRVGNLALKRDFGYAPKYVEAMWLMMQQETPDDFLICSGESIYLYEIVEHVCKKLEISQKLIVQDKSLFRPNEIQDIYGDNADAKQKLEWVYDLSFFEVLDLIIEETLRNRNISL